MVSVRVVQGFRLQQRLNALYPCSHVDPTLARQLDGHHFRFLQELLNALQHGLSVQLPLSVLVWKKVIPVNKIFD